MFTNKLYFPLLLPFLPFKPNQTISNNVKKRIKAERPPLSIASHPSSSNPNHPSPHLLPICFRPKNRFPSPEKRILSSFLGSSTHTSARVKKKKSTTSAQISAHRPHRRVSPSTSGLARCKRQHSKEHSRVIKRGKWSPGGEARLFEAVSSKGNLVMTSAEPCLCQGARDGQRKREERLGGERDYIIQP